MGRILAREWIRNVERHFSKSTNPLVRFASRIHSQGKQDGILAEIFRRLGIERGSAVEIGAWDGVTYSNTRALLEAGWRCGYIEIDPIRFEILKRNIEGFDAAASNQMVTLESGSCLDDVMTALEMPLDLSLLCLDIDSHEFWIWQSLEKYRPLVVCIEYNAYFDPQSRLTMQYKPEHHWTGGWCYGATAGALHDLGRKKGYTLVGYEPGLDLFFVRNDALQSQFESVQLRNIPIGRRYNIFRGRKDSAAHGMITVDVEDQED